MFEFECITVKQKETENKKENRGKKERVKNKLKRDLMYSVKKEISKRKQFK